AIEARVGPVLVAVAEQEIVDVVAAAGGDAVVTDPDLPSGSDRIFAALQARDPNGQFRFIINLQGDLPLMDPQSINQCLAPLADEEMQISTLAAEITDRHEIANLDVVKAIVDFSPGSDVAVAQDFVRQIPEEASGPFWHHIGIYAYRREALETFVGLPVSPRERERKLEQMRAMDNGMPIAVVRVDTVPFGVDTPADLDRARREISGTRGII
ncbi:MAG: 3-deoxy-manno-octulosonate cytidylyltransferase, partial [Rhizobiales bacterium]|nr:3-deoxy-manno-octulosonate cytidylyltransferase [Hyphomicrobiales bacterium]